MPQAGKRAGSQLESASRPDAADPTSRLSAEALRHHCILRRRESVQLILLPGHSYESTLPLSTKHSTFFGEKQPAAALFRSGSD